MSVLDGYSMPEVRHCPDCDEMPAGNGKYCEICGAEVEMKAQESTSTANEAQRAEEQQRQLDTLMDIFGFGFRDEFEQNFLQTAPNREVSIDYVKSLGKIVVDERQTILWNCTISLGPLHINGVSAAFSPLPFDSITSPIAAATPLHGEATLNSSSGSILVFQRGVVSFPTKVQRAQETGASAVIICQSAPVWPFVMLDTSRELPQGSSIPTLMISQSDADLLMKLLASKPDMQCSLSCTMGDTNCSICYEAHVPGNTVLKLPCCHVYHEECIMSWLVKNNTCPLCRYSMPAATQKEKMQRRQPQDPSRQEYFR